MKCKMLFEGLKKIDFNSRDIRPKLVIKGLSYKMAMTHREALEKEGIVDLINLTKDINKPVNIVKEIMINEEVANDLLDKGRINLLHLFFQVVQDKPKQKVKHTTEVISRFNLVPTGYNSASIGYNSINSKANLNLNINPNNNHIAIICQ